MRTTRGHLCGHRAIRGTSGQRSGSGVSCRIRLPICPPRPGFTSSARSLAFVDMFESGIPGPCVSGIFPRRLSQEPPAEPGRRIGRPDGGRSRGAARIVRGNGKRREPQRGEGRQCGAFGGAPGLATAWDQVQCGRHWHACRHGRSFRGGDGAAVVHYGDWDDNIHDSRPGKFFFSHPHKKNSPPIERGDGGPNRPAMDGPSHMTGTG
jgi:hypothetical protein